MSDPAGDRRRARWLVLALLAATALAYEPVRHNAFLSFDDGVYITENPHVRAGLTARSLAWAFQAGHAGNWHPLTWLSHMLDVTLWGLQPAAHHLTNLALHAAAAAVLFLLVRGLTGRIGAAALVAALFALHPLHVESVAWAAERKDVLSTLLGLLALGAWLRWRRDGRARWYGASLALFGLGLCAKPMLVSLPVLILLLEVLPLPLGEDRRSGGGGGAGALVRRLLPFGALALGSAWITVVAQSAGGAVTDVATLPIGTRLANAVTACAAYLGLAVLPRDLAVLYPHPLGGLPAGKVAISLLVVGAPTAYAIARWRTRPWFAFGWAWYLVTLLPVIGIVQVGLQSMADRYTYLPLVGASLATAMLVPERVDRRQLLVVVAALALVWVGLTRRQVALWRDDLTLFGHALRVTERNWLAHDRLGHALARDGRHEEAIEQYEAAVAIRPSFTAAHNNLGLSLEALGRSGEALARYDAALALDPELAEAHGNRGNSLDTLGRLEEAEQAFRQSLALEPDGPKVRNSLGVTLSRLGRLEEGLESFREAIRLDPTYSGAWFNLGQALLQAGQVDPAVEAMQRGLELEPDRAEVRRALDALRREAGMGRNGAAEAGG